MDKVSSSGVERKLELLGKILERKYNDNEALTLGMRTRETRIYFF